MEEEKPDVLAPVPDPRKFVPAKFVHGFFLETGYLMVPSMAILLRRSEPSAHRRVEE